jgi:hypothetical protein
MGYLHQGQPGPQVPRLAVMQGPRRMVGYPGYRLGMLRTSPDVNRLVRLCYPLCAAEVQVQVCLKRLCTCISWRRSN